MSEIEPNVSERTHHAQEARDTILRGLDPIALGEITRIRRASLERQAEANAEQQAKRIADHMAVRTESKEDHKARKIEALALAELHLARAQRELAAAEFYEPKVMPVPAAPVLPNFDSHVALHPEELAREMRAIEYWKIREQFISIYNSLPAGTNDRIGDAEALLVQEYLGLPSPWVKLGDAVKGSQAELDILNEINNPAEYIMQFLLKEFIKSEIYLSDSVIYCAYFRKFVEKYKFTQEKQENFEGFSRSFFLTFYKDDPHGIELPFDISPSLKRASEQYKRWKSEVGDAIDAISADAMDGNSVTNETIKRAIDGFKPDSPRRAVITILKTCRIRHRSGNHDLLAGHVYAVEQSQAKILIRAEDARVPLLEELQGTFEELVTAGAVAVAKPMVVTDVQRQAFEDAWAED